MHHSDLHLELCVLLHQVVLDFCIVSAAALLSATLSERVCSTVVSRMPWQEGSIHKLRASVLTTQGSSGTISMCLKLNRRPQIMSSADIYACMCICKCKSIHSYIYIYIYVCALLSCVCVDVFDSVFMNRHVYGCVHISFDIFALSCLFSEAMFTDMNTHTYTVNKG